MVFTDWLKNIFLGDFNKQIPPKTRKIEDIYTKEEIEGADLAIKGILKEYGDKVEKYLSSDKFKKSSQKYKNWWYLNTHHYLMGPLFNPDPTLPLHEVIEDTYTWVVNVCDDVRCDKFEHEVKAWLKKNPNEDEDDFYTGGDYWSRNANEYFLRIKAIVLHKLFGVPL